MNNKPYLCPVCGQHQFRLNGTSEMCPVCNWINDSLQNTEPDYCDGENKLCLNEYKEKWETLNNKVKE